MRDADVRSALAARLRAWHPEPDALVVDELDLLGQVRVDVAVVDGALRMQALARVNRTFRGKQDGLLVGYAPLIDNLTKALKEYTNDDRRTKPVGRDVDEAVELVGRLLDELDGVCPGYPWGAQWDGSDQSLVKAAIGLTNHLRSPSTPGNQVGEGEKSLGKRFRELSVQLARGWALAVGKENLADRAKDARFDETVRVWMAKFDAQERIDSGQPVPEEIQRLLAGLVDRSTATGEVLDSYEAAGMPKPLLTDLGPDFLTRVQQADHVHLAIEALRDTLTAESAKVARGNLVRQAAFSTRLLELMNKYTNQQLTSAEVIAKLVELAREVAAEDDRGKSFDPPLSEDELAFFDAFSENESAVQVQGEDVLAQIARELVAVMQRDVKTDWTVRDDVRAKLRSSIKRLLVKYRYPPDKQPGAIKLVIDQMEAMAPRYAA